MLLLIPRQGLDLLRRRARGGVGDPVFARSARAGRRAERARIGLDASPNGIGGVGIVAGVDYRVLGPLEVVGAPGGTVPPGAKERAILARLLLDPGRAVAGDELVEAAWEESRRGSAARSLHVRISRLRRFLEPDRAAGAAPSLLVRDQAGYRLAVEQQQVDACRCDEALALWRGDPYPELADAAAARP